MNRSTFLLGLALATWLTLGAAQSAAAQNYEIIAQDLDQNRHGYTVPKVWGNHYEMGYGMGVALASGVVPRSVAVRYLLTQTASLAIDQHLDFASQALASMDIATRSFINYFVPEGYGGVFTCPRGGPCQELRLPQEEFFDGEVLITTNEQTDGVTPPEDDEFMAEYYTEGSPKDLESHFSVMGTEGLHLLSVEVRGPQDMTLWFHGRGREDRLELHWCDLYPDACETELPH